MKKSLNDLRKNYTAHSIDDNNLPDSPLTLFQQWFVEVSEAGGVEEVNAMTLSTVAKSGMVRGRIVLLKDMIDEGFVFYTNYSSDKSEAIFYHSEVCLSFFWPNLERQVIISGTAKKVSTELSDTYFSSRPRGSQLGAHVSPQSQVISSSKELSDRFIELEKHFEGQDVPRPTNWGGIVVIPKRIEFWQGRPNRLHDRIVYTKNTATTWTFNRLAP